MDRQSGFEKQYDKPDLFMFILLLLSLSAYRQQFEWRVRDMRDLIVNDITLST